MLKIFCFILFASIHLLNCDDSKCKLEPKDIVILLDSSNSISDNDFNHAKYAIIKAIRMLEIKKHHTRIAFIQFGSKAIMKFNLDTFDDVKSILTTIKNSEHTHGLTAIGKALQLTTTDVLPKMRKGIKRFVIIFTDGTNNVYPTPQIYADKLKNEGIGIICVGIGSEINKLELNRIASEKSVFFISSFQHLVQNIGHISKKLCYKPNPVKPCSIPLQDLVFVIDSSDSLTQDDFTKSKHFIKSIIKNVKLGSAATRVAMVSFAGTSRIDFNLNNFQNQKDYISAIDNVKRLGGVTAIGGALNEVLVSIWPKRRDIVPFNIILVTDGRNNKYPPSRIPATELKKKGAHIISVAVGKNTDFQELREISSDNRIITVLNYSELLKSVASVEKVVSCD